MTLLNTGDFVQLVTKNHFRSAPHRVRRSVTRDRLSMPFLMKGRLDLILDTAKYLDGQECHKSDPRCDGWGLSQETSQDAGGSDSTWRMVERNSVDCTSGLKRKDSEKERLRLDGIGMKDVHVLLETRRRRLVHAKRQAEREKEKSKQYAQQETAVT